ncbi:MAG: T9SS type A sorting domain-containing protein [Bacteroidetes bacterium]|nr:T9SS type A sorting domain-containing protein [Bacteroidota bacterium]
MKRTIYTLLGFIFVIILGAFLFTSSVQAQPMYYNYQNVGSSNNNFPLNVAGGKMSQWLFLGNDFNQPSPCPTGKKITKIYLWVTAGGAATYTNLHILMAQDTITQMTQGVFYPGTFDTVYNQASASLTGTALSWMSITLDHPFVYDPTKSLIVAIGQCGQTGTGQTIKQNNLTGIRRVWSVGGCPFTPYTALSDASIVNFGIDVVDATPTFALPDLIYYKFLNNPSATTVKNYAVPGAGNTTGTLTSLTLTGPGQFDSCLSGTATTSAKITTGYNLNTGTSGWTISFWLNNLVTPATTRYLFGDPGPSFRAFIGGVAPTNGAVFRGTGITDVPIRNIFPGPTVVHIVYDSAASAVKVYKNGVLDTTVAQTPFNFTNGTGFTVGGYSSSAGIESLMDEFRFYKRTLSQAEITATWNANLGVVTGVTPIVTQVPKEYKLSQNYPNPFNPVTKINFSIPKSGFVTLKVYDALGREVSTLVSENKTTGSYTVDFNGSSFSSGAYFYRLESNGYVETKKMLLIK